METQEVLSEHEQTPFFFFNVWVTEHWHGLPKEIVKSPSVEILKIHPHNVLGKVALLEQGSCIR